jgi:hypothetical protein
LGVDNQEFTAEKLVAPAFSEALVPPIHLAVLLVESQMSVPSLKLGASHSTKSAWPNAKDDRVLAPRRVDKAKATGVIRVVMDFTS